MRVLLLGDSHTYGPYGVALEKFFKANGHEVDRVAVVGVSAWHYNRGKQKKASHVRVGNFNTSKDQQYDLAIVSLGTNDVTGWTIPEVSREIQSLISSLKATRKVWVGVPAASATAASNYNPVFKQRNLNLRADDLWVALSPIYGQDAIDPRDVTSPYVRENDIHFGPKGGSAWATKVYETAMAFDIPTATEEMVEAEVEKMPEPDYTGKRRNTVFLALGVGLVAVGVLIYLSNRRKR